MFSPTDEILSLIKTTNVWCYARSLIRRHVCHEHWHRKNVNDPTVGWLAVIPVGATDAIVKLWSLPVSRIHWAKNDFLVPGQAYTSKWMGIGLDRMHLKNFLLFQSSLKLHIYFWESLSCSDNFVSLGLTRFVWRFSRMIVSIVSIVWPSFSVRRMSHHLSNR